MADEHSASTSVEVEGKGPPSPNAVGLIFAAVAVLFGVLWSLGGLVVAVAAHAALTDYWGSEWPNADEDFVMLLIAWCVSGLALFLAVRWMRKPDAP